MDGIGVFFEKQDKTHALELALYRKQRLRKLCPERVAKVFPKQKQVLRGVFSP